MLLNLLQKVFSGKYVELERLDQVGKDSSVNATLRKFGGFQLRIQISLNI